MRFKQVIILVLITVCALVACRDLLRPGFFPMHDDMQINRLYEMDLCFRDGQIPCRWVPDMGYSYGYPLFNYYPPLPFYTGQLIHTLGFSFIDTTKILFGLGVVVSGLLMYLFTRKLWGDWGGLASAVLYIFAPYHSVDIYIRGALNESWALAFLPGAYWALYQVIETKNKNRLFVFAFFVSVILLSHNLMTFIFAPGLLLFGLLLLLFQKESRLQSVKHIVLGGFLGLGLAAFFTLPVLLETKFVHVETMLMGYFNYLAHYVSLPMLLFSRFWGYGSSSWQQTEGMPFQVGLPHWPLALLVFIVGLFLYYKKRLPIRTLFVLAFFFMLGIFSLFLIHPRSVFIWQMIDPLKYLQFPWRFLTLVIFAVSVLGGGLVVLIKAVKTKILVSLIVVVMAVALNYSYFSPQRLIDTNDSDRLFSAAGWRKMQTDAIFDYLPKSAKFPPSSPAPELPVSMPEVTISNYKKGTNWLSFSYTAKTNSTVTLPLYAFPTWRAYFRPYKITTDISNRKWQEVTTSPTGDLGLVSLSLPQGGGDVHIKLTNTLVRTIGNIVSLLSLLVLLFFILQGLYKKPK